MTYRHHGDKFSVAAKILFGLCLITSIAAVGLFTYLASEQPVKLRGSQGALTRHSPGTDPAPLAMRPRSAP